MNKKNNPLEIPCSRCKKIRIVKTNGMLIESYIKTKPFCRSCGAILAKEKISKGWFKKGQTPWNLNKPWDKETLKKISESKKGKHYSVETEFIKGQKAWNKGLPYMQDEKHPQWKGDNVGYLALHTWIQRKLGKPNLCSKCKTTVSKRFVWHNISGEYKRDLSDWFRLCSLCHVHLHRYKEVLCVA